MTSLPVRYMVNTLCRRRGRTTCGLVFVLVVVVVLVLSSWNNGGEDLESEDWEEEYERARRQGLSEHMSFYLGKAARARLRAVPEHWTERDRCPACFGTDMCDAVQRQELLVEIPDQPTAANLKGVYAGRWNDVPMVVKLQRDRYPSEFKNFDQFVCLKGTGERGCRVSEAIVSDGVQGDKDLLSAERLRSAWKISYNHSGPLALMHALCLTDETLEQFSSLYSENNSIQLTRAERAMFFTSLVVQPESLMLRFLQTADADGLAPRVYGACGRMVVVEHGGRLLQTYINESFFDRAELVVQLIALFERLWHADEDWHALYSDVQFENIAVSHDDQVRLIDHEHLSIIRSVELPQQQPQPQRRQHRPAADRERHRDIDDDRLDPDDALNYDYAHASDVQVVCNSDCFDRLLANLSRPDLSRDDRSAQCSFLHGVSLSFMYAALCRNILADTASQHGLLHGVPDDNDTPDRSKKVSAALKECLYETRPGGRVDAVDRLSGLLADYVGLRME